MKILVLSYFFPPDQAAGAFRASALCEALEKHSSTDITVVCAEPNRYATWKPELPDIDDSRESRGAKVIRIKTPNHANGLVDQIASYAVFVFKALKHVRKRDFDIVYASSSKLMTAVLGAVIARFKAATLYLDIRDLFVDSLGSVLPASLNVIMKPVLITLEVFALKTASRVNIVSPGFLKHVRRNVPASRISVITNGIDKEFASYSWDKRGRALTGRRKIVYAGNLGEAQGLHQIVPFVAKNLEQHYEFLIIGDGGRKQNLLDSLGDARVNNVKVCAPVARKELLHVYDSADLLFLHLNRHPAFKRVIPSKIFEYGASGRPIIAGLDGTPREFMKDHLPDTLIFDPCDAAGMTNLLLKLEPTGCAEDRTSFISAFGREALMEDLAKSVIASREDGNTASGSTKRCR